VDTKLNMSKQCALATKKPTASGLHEGEYRQEEEGGEPSLLLSTGEVTPGVLGPVLGSPAQQRHGHTRESPAVGHGGDEGTGASVP